MKKLFAVFAMAGLLLTACGEKETPGGDPETVSLTLSVEKDALKVGEETALTVQASRAVTAALKVAVVSDNAAVTVPESVTIPANGDKAAGTLKAVAVGTAKITITADGAEYAVQSVSVGVSEEGDPDPDPDPNPDPDPDPDPSSGHTAPLIAGGKLNPPAEPFYVLMCEQEGGTVYPGSLYYHNYLGSGYEDPSGVYKSAIDYYGGAAVGKKVGDEIFFSPVEEGTEITDAMDWHPYSETYCRFPTLVREGDAENSLPDGEHYVVLKLPRDGDPNNYGWENAVNVPCWLKIKINGMSVEVLDGAMLMDDSKFYVGRK